jgi:hypothetical protein
MLVQFQALIVSIDAKLSLAHAYKNDGALLTAASLYNEAAALLIDAHNIKEEINQG